MSRRTQTPRLNVRQAEPDPSGPPVHVELVYEPRPDAWRFAATREKAEKSAPPNRSESRTKRERHARKCCVCNHPKRKAIEEEFVYWASPYNIRYGNNVSEASLYRHAHATGLFATRRTKLRFALERIVEGADLAQVAADSVIRAARACARINDAGKWVDPPTTHIILAGQTATPGDSAAPASCPGPLPSLNKSPTTSDEPSFLIEALAIRK